MLSVNMNFPLFLSKLFPASFKKILGRSFQVFTGFLLRIMKKYISRHPRSTIIVNIFVIVINFGGEGSHDVFYIVIQFCFETC